MYCLLFQFTVSSVYFRSTSSCMSLLYYYSRHFYPSLYFSFSKVLYKAVPAQDMSIQLVFLLCIVCIIFFSVLTLFDICSYIKRSVRILFSILLQQHIWNFPGIYDMLSEVSKFHHYAKLCSNFSNLLVSSLNLSPICYSGKNNSCTGILINISK